AYCVVSTFYPRKDMRRSTYASRVEAEPPEGAPDTHKHRLPPCHRGCRVVRAPRWRAQREEPMNLIDRGHRRASPVASRLLGVTPTDSPGGACETPVAACAVRSPPDAGD